MSQRRSLLLVCAVLTTISAVWVCVALSASSQSQTLDQRVQEVASQLKCPICQGESVADSPSLLSQQMRSVIRQQLQAGKSEQEVIQYFVDRYGEQIVWSPPWQGFTLLAWLVPIVLLLCWVCVLIFIVRKRRALPQNCPAFAGDMMELELDYQLGNIEEDDYHTFQEQYG